MHVVLQGCINRLAHAMPTIGEHGHHGVGSRKRVDAPRVRTLRSRCQQEAIPQLLQPGHSLCFQRFDFAAQVLWLLITAVQRAQGCIQHIRVLERGLGHQDPRAPLPGATPPGRPGGATPEAKIDFLLVGYVRLSQVVPRAQQAGSSHTRTKRHIAEQRPARDREDETILVATNFVGTFLHHWHVRGVYDKLHVQLHLRSKFCQQVQHFEPNH
mmetsp:Transcript_19881/g.41143  ORF Transcript_19881/g.41143 Transcript_19881/m.41143 type:complete len:213 (-) Transcript_19881:205-843(-)